jgi:hypothetical protein
MKPSLGLHTEIETAAGDVYRWDANARDPGDRPQGIQCGSAIGEGYGSSNVTLARQGTRTYPDVDEFSTIRHIGEDGQIAYEGRIAATPRSARKIEVQAVGWMSHAHDTPIPALLIVDRDMAEWTGASRSRLAALVSSNFTQPDAPQTLPDQSASTAGILLQHADQWASPVKPIAEAWWDAGPYVAGNKIGRVYYDFANVGAASTADANWALQYRLTNIDDASVIRQDSGDIWASVPTSSAMSDVLGGSRYAFISFFYTATPGGAASFQYSVHARKLAVWGEHGLNLYGSAEPFGAHASDIIRYVSGLYCPLLDVGGVTNSPSIIDQFRFKDRTDAYEVFTKANAYDRYNLAVWDNRRLTYAPMPSETDDPTWVVRSSDGNGLDPNWTGPSTAASANGVLVTFQNVLTGQEDYVSPDTNTALADTRDSIAANRAGIRRWESIQLPDPNTPAGATAIGAAVLAEFNRPRRPGDITIRGHIRDLADNWHQGWRPRAGDTVLLGDDPDANPQIIWQADWNQDSRTLTLHVDGPAATSDSILSDLLTDRQRRIA